MQASLSTRNLDVSVAGRMLVRSLDMDVAGGTFVCVLGINGAGKTLTLHTLAGLRAPAAGTVTLCGDPLNQLARREIARRLGLLLQIHEDAFPQSVLDTALMGRYPRLDFWQWPDAADRELAGAALADYDLAGLESRSVTTLSGGERARLALATLRVQDPLVWLLDEPLNHLDPHHQHDVCASLRELSEAGRAVISTVHEPALAMRYATHALLLYGDGSWDYGTVDALLEPERLQRLYGMPFEWYRPTAGSDRPGLPLPL